MDITNRLDLLEFINAGGKFVIERSYERGAFDVVNEICKRVINDTEGFEAAPVMWVNKNIKEIVDEIKRRPRA